MILPSDIEAYWRSSELNAIADYDEDGLFDLETVQSAIDDAYAEVNILSSYHEPETIDLFAKRLTFCILLSRLNINPEAVVLPMNDCAIVRDLISSFLNTKQSNQAKVDLRPLSSGLTVSEGMSNLSDILEDY